MRISSRKLTSFLATVAFLATFVPATGGAQEPAPLPDPLDRGPFATTDLDPFLAGKISIHEPNSTGQANTGANSEITLQVRGQMYYPTNRTEPSPVIVLVHGNHGSCDTGTAPDCTIFKRNDSGYAYLAENLATWGYTVMSLDQDQLIARQDNPKGKGMHQRRLLIAALLDEFYAANEEAQPEDADNNLGDKFVGKLDFTRIGLMGHSRGGDAVSSFIDYNRIRDDGRRYPLRGVIALAPVDYERKAPYGTPYMSISPWCDGDVSNLQSARFFERSQYIDPSDPFPRIHVSHLGANHNWYNTVWFADGQDGASGTDSACRDTQPNHSRLSGESSPGQYVINNSDKLNPDVNTRISPDPARMADQERIGLATMSAFFRRYVGGEGAFDPYMTGELSATEDHLQIPESACPTSAGGTRMPCEERVSTSYFPSAAERIDVIRPEADNPLGLSAVGTKLTGAGFANPYLDAGGVTPKPDTTANGYDWCNPEPEHFTPSQLNIPGNPLAEKPCPLPAAAALGGQNGTRENSPINHSYGRQLALAWEGPATLETAIPAASGDVSGMKALAMHADVNFFDPRNPVRTGTSAEWDPSQTTQNFEIVLTDADGNTDSVEAANADFGNALHQTTGSTTARTHVVLEQIRVPLDRFDGIDLTAVRQIKLKFGGEGMPATGSIQLADVRFQEAVDSTDILVDSYEEDAGAGSGPPATGPDPAEILEDYDASKGNVKLIDTVGEEGASSTTWTVDDDKADCPNAAFTSIQQAVDTAAPWDTIVVCAGLYQESSTPINHPSSPSQAGSMNGLTITKPLKIKGAGADEVTITPAPSLTTLAGPVPQLRDGGGNVITVSRQSLGSTDDNEQIVDISGVTVASPDTFAEAGIAYLNASGRISDSVVGPLKRPTGTAQFAANPHGWGVVMTNSIAGIGPGTVERQLTITDSLVTGYASGGVLIDGARGLDGAPDTTTPSGIRQYGYVKNTHIDGRGPNSLIPQAGVQFAGGATGFVTGSRIEGNLFPTNQRRSVGLLLTGAKTTGPDAFYAEGNSFAQNGYGLFNATGDNTAVREDAPADADGNYWGPNGPPTEGPSQPAFDIEGVSGNDSTGDDSVIVDPVLDDEPDVPEGAPADVPDEAPTGLIADPADGTEIEFDGSLAPVVFATDDFAVKSVALTADGTPLSTDSTAPYEFEFTPTEAQYGTTVTLEATITDSSGQTFTDSVDVEVGAPPVDPPPTLELGEPVLDKAKGTATIAATVSDPGLVEMEGQRIVPAEASPAAGVPEEFLVKAKGKYLKRLKEKGSVRVKALFTYTPDDPDDDPITGKVRFRLVKK